MYYYVIYGKIMLSDLDFPQLIRTNPVTEQTADIVIKRGVIPKDIKQQETQKKYEFGDKVSWLINRTLWFLVEERKYVTYEPRENANMSYLRTYLLGYGLAMLHMQRGEMAIHCSAVHCNGEAVLIAGESGSGKSTLTARFLSEGYSLMADDVTLVTIQDGRTMAYPAFPYQKLCRDAAIKKGYQLDELIYIDEEKDKYLVPYTGEFSLNGKPVSVMLCLIADPQIEELNMEEITGIDKFHFCVDNLFLRKLLQNEKYGLRTGPACLNIASGMRMYVVGRPISKDTTEEVWEMVKKIRGMA